MVLHKLFKNVDRGLHKFVQGAGRVSHFVNNKIFKPYRQVRDFVQKTPGLREGAKVAMDAIPYSHAVKDIIDTVADNYGTADELAQASVKVARDLRAGKHKNIVKDTKNIIHKASTGKLGNMARGFASKHILPVLKNPKNFNPQKIMPIINKVRGFMNRKR